MSYSECNVTNGIEKKDLVVGEIYT